MRRAVLSHPLPVLGLVSHYLTNYLIGRIPLHEQQAFDHQEKPPGGVMGYYLRFPEAIPHSWVR